MSTNHWTAADLPRLAGRTFVITGANSGIGFEAAKALADHEARVILAVRDVAKGERAAAEIGGETEVRRLDLADLASVHAFAEETDHDIDVLINNAGVMNIPRAAHQRRLRDADRHEPPRPLRPDQPAAAAHHRPRRRARLRRAPLRRIRLDDLNCEHGYKRHRAYGQTKLANLLFMSELQRRLDEIDSPVRVVGAHPGWAATNLQSHTGNALEDVLMRVGNTLFAQNADMGALPTLYAATQDLPGDAYIGPGAARRDARLPGARRPQRARRRTRETATQAVGALGGAHRRALPACRNWPPDSQETGVAPAVDRPALAARLHALRARVGELETRE